MHVGASITLAALILIGTDSASGQAYPTRPIRLLTGAPGSAADFASRLIAQGISEPLGQPGVVVNTGGGIKVMIAVATAPPDGYTLYVAGSFYRPRAEPTDPDLVRDFVPITLIAIAPTVLVVHPSLPVKSVKELIALAKAKPGELDFASGAPGSPSHLAGELFKHMAGVNLFGIAYKRTPQGIIDLLGGQVQLSFSNAASVMPHVKTGRLRALAVGSAEPSVLTPGLPTLAASGVPGYEAVVSYGLFALAKTPPAIINRLNQEIVRVINQPDVKEKFLSNGIEPIGSSPEVLMDKAKGEIARLSKLVKDTGIKLE